MHPPKDPLTLAQSHLLEPAGLDESALVALLNDLMAHAVDDADIYFQHSHDESWFLEDGRVKEGTHALERGAGVRAVSGEKTGFAYTDEIALPALGEAVRAARAIARSGASGSVRVLQRAEGHRLYPPLDPLESLSDGEKVALLQRVDAEARRLDPRITQVMVGLAGSFDVILVARSDGTLAADVRPLVRLSVSVIAEEKGRREQGTAGGGGRTGYGYFLEEERALGYAREAVRQALVNLEAVEAPAGTLKVVLGPGWPGVLL
ncbi:MAG: metalloprotease TldD, partial [Gammaproteobacteria bacterium]